MKDSELLALLKNMTLEEKIGQLSQAGNGDILKYEGAPLPTMTENDLTWEQLISSGSLITGGAMHAEDAAFMQRRFRTETRHGIPTLFMADIIHGTRTIMPIPLAQACSFNEALVEEGAAVAAEEAASAGIHVTYAPMADVIRDPRWGRSMESFGESPQVCGRMSAATVRGFHSKGMATCVKHYVGYGAVEAGREYSPVDISHTELFNTYFPPFQAAVDAGCDMVMSAFTPIDRIPATANKWLLDDVLRKRMGFDGAVITDWGCVRELPVHGVAGDNKEAAYQAFKATTDIDMMTFVYLRELKQLVEEGAISEEEIDQAVLRVLRLKNKLGLFEDTFEALNNERQQECYHLESHLETSLKSALQSCVLLKNDGALPLKKGQTICLCGDHAETHELLGGWSSNGQISETESLLEVFERHGAILESSPELCDVIVYAVGEIQKQTGECKSKAHPELTAAQLAELRSLRQCGKPIVMVLFTGRALIISDAEPYCNAILNAWFPGTKGAEAIWQLLSGEVNPSGHLAVTMPRTVGQIPIHYDSMPTGRPNTKTRKACLNKYVDEVNEPLYPFGFGLSYTSFELHDVKVEGCISEGQNAILTATIENIGSVSGTALVQAYGRMRRSIQTVPIKTLLDFVRVPLAAGEKKTVSIELNRDMLTTYDCSGEKVLPHGTCDLLLGFDSAGGWNASVEV